jgi:SAM-dependent methyltransferase
MTDYERETKHAYRSAERAAEYKHFHTRAFSWARVVTSREQWLLRRILDEIDWKTGDVLLDVPCGSGIAAAVLNELDVGVVAADISKEMMEQSRGEYRSDRFRGYVQADITVMPIAPGRIRAVLSVGFLHRVPLEVKRSALAALAGLGAEVMVVTASVDSPIQRLKHRVLSAVRRRHVPAPAPLPLAALEREFRAAGLEVVRRVAVIPLVSADTIFVLRRRAR